MFIHSIIPSKRSSSSLIVYFTHIPPSTPTTPSSRNHVPYQSIFMQGDKAKQPFLNHVPYHSIVSEGEKAKQPLVEFPTLLLLQRVDDEKGIPNDWEYISRSVFHSKTEIWEDPFVQIGEIEKNRCRKASIRPSPLETDCRKGSSLLPRRRSPRESHEDFVKSMKSVDDEKGMEESKVCGVEDPAMERNGYPSIDRNDERTDEFEEPSELGVSKFRRRTNKMLEEARKSVPESGRVLHSVSAFERRLTMPKLKDNEEEYLSPFTPLSGLVFADNFGRDSRVSFHWIVVEEGLLVEGEETYLIAWSLPAHLGEANRRRNSSEPPNRNHINYKN